jgi:uncharacterized membrane protein YkoI
MKRNHYLALAALSATALGTSFAAKPMENDAMAIANAKVSMVQAVAAAEQHVSGKASRAEFEKTKTGWAYDIEVVSANKVFDVKVDGDKGTVIASTEDKGDRDDDQDKAD